MRLLQHFLSRQPPDRNRFLEDVRFSRADLARRAGVSRAHLNDLFSQSEAASVLSLPEPGRIAFSDRLSDDFELFFALTFRDRTSDKVTDLR